MKGRADDAGPNGPEVNHSPLVDSVLALLEEAGAPSDMNDQIVKLIETWEYSQPPECPSCLGYGHINEEGTPTNDRRCRTCLDCTGTGIIVNGEDYGDDRENTPDNR